MGRRGGEEEKSEGLYLIFNCLKMISQEKALACLFSDNPKQTNLNRLERWMFDRGDYKKLFDALKEVTDKTELEQIKERSGLSAMFIVDMKNHSEAVSGHYVDSVYGETVVTDKDIDDFVDSKYKGLIGKYVSKGEIDKVQKVLGKMTETKEEDPVTKYLRHEEEMSKMVSHGLLGFSTGISKLDVVTYGMIPKHIWVCGAYYGYGKTYFMLNIVDSAIKQGKKVLLITLEMPIEEILARLICLTARLSTIDLYRPLDVEGHQAREQARNYWLEKVATGQLVVDDESRSANSVVTKVAVSGKFDLVCIDYVQLLETGINQYEGLRDAMKTLQMITKRYGFTLLLLSQINNEAQKAGSISRVDGFKGAGDIGQVANVAIKIERQKDEVTNKWSDFFGIDIVKLRHGMPANIGCSIKFPGGRIESPIEGSADDGSDRIAYFNGM